jgi:two-component system, NtrC family, sensor kinase
MRGTIERFGMRTMLATPLLSSGEAIGAIIAVRYKVQPFTNQQIDLVKTFADQAVIAIENTRLFEAEQARTRELQAAFDRQSATSEVLGVISRSPSETKPVFDAIVSIAARLCRAEHAIIFRRESDDRFHVAATNNAEAEWLRWITDNPLPPGRRSVAGRVALEGKVVHVPDCLADPEFILLDHQRVGKFRTMLGVPLLRERVCVGVIGLLRNVGSSIFRRRDRPRHHLRRPGRDRDRERSAVRGGAGAKH